MPDDRWDWWNARSEAEGRDQSWTPSDDLPTRAELAEDNVPTRPPRRPVGPPFHVVAARQRGETP